MGRGPTRQNATQPASITKSVQPLVARLGDNELSKHRSPLCLQIVVLGQKAAFKNAGGIGGDSGSAEDNVEDKKAVDDTGSSMDELQQNADTTQDDRVRWKPASFTNTSQSTWTNKFCKEKREESIPRQLQ